MAALRRLAALYAFVVGAAIALHFLTTQFYDPAWVDASLPVWKILDPLEVIGLARPDSRLYPQAPRGCRRRR